MSQDQYLTKYFTIFANPKMYTTLLYLFLTFPLGLTYFIFLVIGFSVGLSLLIIWVGLIVLALLFPLIWMIISFERIQTVHLLGISIPTVENQSNSSESILQKIKRFLTDPATWKGILFILLKFPIGIFSFTALVTGITILFTFIFSPIIFPWTTINLGFWRVDTISEAIGLCILGLMLLPGLFHVYYFLGQMIGKLSAVLLKPNS